MRRLSLFAALAALVVSTQGFATNFECGAVACSAFGSQPITGINDVVVDGEHFDVTFSNTPATGSPFAFSLSTAGPGQPLTGVDAANALAAFYATQQGPLPSDGGPGIFADVDGSDVEVLNFVTAFQNSSTPGSVDMDLIQPFLGFSVPPVQTIPPNGVPGPSPSALSDVPSSLLCGNFATCTVWKPVAAPEISVNSAPAALMLLVGLLAVLRGRRPSPRLTETVA